MSALNPVQTSWEQLSNFIKPSIHAPITRDCLKNAFLNSQNSSLLTRHISSAGWVGIACATNFFDTITFTGKTLSSFSFAILQLDYNGAFATLSNEGAELLCSTARIFVLPFYLFASLFSPQPVLSGFDFPSRGNPLQSNTAELEAQLQAAQNAQAASQTAINDLQAQLLNAQNASQTTIGGLQNQLQACQTTINGLQAQLENAQRTIEQNQAASDQILEEVKDQLEQSKKRVTELEAQLSTATNEKNALEKAYLRKELKEVGVGSFEDLGAIKNE